MNIFLIVKIIYYGEEDLSLSPDFLKEDHYTTNVNKLSFA